MWGFIQIIFAPSGMAGLCAVAAFLLATSATGTTAGEREFPWNFKEGHWPEVQLPDQSEDIGTNNFCFGREEKNFYIYKEFNPRFAAIPDQARARREWRRAFVAHLSEQKMSFFAACLYENIWQRTKVRFQNKEITHLPRCEHGRAEPTPVVRDAMAELDELTGFAMGGDYSAMIILSGFHGYSGAYIEPDIRYYMKLLVQAQEQANGKEESFLSSGAEKSRQLMSSGDELTPMRREFIEKAFERGDWRSVLKTTDPCAEPLARSRS